MYQLLQLQRCNEHISYLPLFTCTASDNGSSSSVTDFPRRAVAAIFTLLSFQCEHFKIIIFTVVLHVLQRYNYDFVSGKILGYRSYDSGWWLTVAHKFDCAWRQVAAMHKRVRKIFQHRKHCIAYATSLNDHRLCLNSLHQITGFSKGMVEHDHTYHFQDIERLCWDFTVRGYVLLRCTQSPFG